MSTDTAVGTAARELRRHNTGRVLRALRRGGPATRTQLVVRTGLAKATVGGIVSGLAGAGAVEEQPARAGARGRPGTPINLRRRHLAVGFEVNVDFVSAVLIDLSGRAQHVDVRAVRAPGADPLDAVVEVARGVAQRLEDHGSVLVGATVALPGLVRRDRRTISWTPNLDLAGAPVAERLEEALGGRCPVTVVNDANCGALAESERGCARGVDHLLYVTGTVGIGAGIINDGALVRGGGGLAGEVGHMPWGESTARCGCGATGCWEASVGLQAMLRATGSAALENPVRSAHGVAARARHDPRVAGELATVGRHLGAGLAMLAKVLDPSLVVLGGYFGPVEQYVLPGAREVLAEAFRSVGVEAPEVRTTQLGVHAAALGAAEHSLRDVFDGTFEIVAG